MFREVRIVACVNGFIVHVGCQVVVFNSLNELLAELNRYYLDPMQAEKRYLSGDHAQHVYNGATGVLEEAMTPNQCPPPQMYRDEREESLSNARATVAKRLDEPSRR